MNACAAPGVVRLVPLVAVRGGTCDGSIGTRFRDGDATEAQDEFSPAPPDPRTPEKEAHMPEPKKRIIVDGIDFRQLFMFPVILRAVPGAMQPPRLLIGLFMVLILITFGRVWDGVTTPAVHPAGLAHGDLSVDDAAEAQRVYRSVLQTYASHRLSGEGPTQHFTAREVLRDMEKGYRQQRDEALGAEQLHRQDREFLDAISRVDQVRPKGVFEATASFAIGSFHRVVRGVLTLQPMEAAQGFTDAVIVMPVLLWRNHTWFTVIYGIVFVLVMSVGGGALSRMAACEIAGRQRLRVREAMEFSLVRWPRFFIAPLLPLMLAGGLALVVLVMGVLMTLPVLDIVGGLLYALALVLGFIIAFLLLVYAVGFILIVPAMATENCDGADALQRAYAYVISKPLHLLAYAAVSLVALALGYFVVSVFAVTTMNVTAGLYGVLTTNSAMSAAGGFSIFDLSQPATGEIHAWHSAISGGFIHLWQTLIVSLVWGYVVSLLFSSATCVYLLMRRASDGQDIEEIWRPGLVPGTLAPMAPTVVERVANA